MGTYNRTLLTNSGIQAIAQAISEGQALAITTAKTSSYQIPEGTNVQALTELLDVEQTISLPTPTVYADSIVQVYARFSNTGVTTEYPIYTIGVYASVAGGAEVLFAVITAVTPDVQPVFDENAPSAFIFNIQMAISNASEITFAINDSGTATVSDINRLNTELINKVGVSGGDLSNTVVSTVTASSASFPIPAAGETVKVIMGKIIKFMSDIAATFTGASASAAGKKGLVPAPDAGKNLSYLRGDGTWTATQRNVTTTAAGSPLDATMGKVITEVKTATLTASAWSGSAPYTQTVTVSGMTAAYAPVISCGVPASPSSANYKAVHKAYAMIDRAVTGANNITFYCYTKKPTVNIPVLIKGV